uniref:Inhibitor_I29 domain-containing protein n=1 Tax=Gongylonema pulchrum TaxID=637853 RepID=A0A183EWD2_9BILA
LKIVLNVFFISRLTLAAIVYGASAYSNRTVNEVYESLKQECETELRKEREQDRTISIYQKEHKIWFRGLAKYQMQKEKRDMDAKLANTPNTEHSS